MEIWSGCLRKKKYTKADLVSVDRFVSVGATSLQLSSGLNFIEVKKQFEECMLIAVMTDHNALNLILRGVLCPREFYYKYNNVCVYQLRV